MYLKCIEVHGFKSFANKMIFQFQNGITAIVGPNGSGKSNVADAVRWVLGEQSAKQLRGAKMEDIIFSGTETRKPLGFAYVSITFDNSDYKLPISYEEVKVARRVYRSGESEYLMNGTSCRLRDVQELFLDTGIGKEGYSIIGQGQIDKILSGKPEDRRELFDEAAGIVKFKKRKVAAEKNLEAEKQNVCRIHDILSELLRQVEPLEKQAVIAKEYLKYRDELKVLDINVFLTEYDHLHEMQTTQDGKLRIVYGDLEDTKKSYENTKEEYENLEAQMEEKDKNLEKYKNQTNECKLKKEQLEGQIKVIQEKIIAAKQNDNHYRNRMALIKKEETKKQQEMLDYKQKADISIEKVEVLNQTKEEAEQKLEKLLQEIAMLGSQVEKCNSEIFEYLNKNTTIKTKIQRYETMLEQTVIQKSSLNQKILKSKSDEAVFDEMIELEKNNFTNLGEKIADIQKMTQDIQNEITALDKQIFFLNSDFLKVQKESIREKSKLESLKNMTERYEGYGQSIRRVMEQKEKREGIIGVVADLIKVKKEYETAIEIALGGSIQNIVTDNENTAKHLIEFLKKQKYGRATFLPLTALTTKNLSHKEAVLKEEGVIGSANDLIETEDQFRGLAAYLLGKIIVVDTIDHAIFISRKYKNSLRIVTLEGELLSPGGSMSGGSYKNSSNLLGRRREVETIEQIIQNLDVQLGHLEKELVDKKQEKEKYLLKIEENNKNKQALYIEQNTANLKYKQAESSKASIADGYGKIREDQIELDRQKKELKESLLYLKKHLEENEKKIQQEEENIGIYSKQQEEIKTREQEYRNEVSSLHLEFSSLEQNRQFLIENRNRVKKEVEKLQEEETQLFGSLAQSGALMTERQEEIEEIQKNIKLLEQRILHVEDEIHVLYSLKEEITKSHKNFFNRREELSNRMIELEREVSRLTSQSEKVKEQLEQKINYMWEEYELTYNRARSLKTETTFTLPQMKKNIVDKKNNIKALGEVNVNAIKDFKNLSERYELLKNQYDDLVKSEEVLKGIIEELDIEMRKQFVEKFNSIKVQFDIVFKEMFGGGKGTLDLMEEQDILEAGIRIIAQPPGKKLQNLMQLSGGEKALTAISLLFAIQNLKPSPFCLLDEIEAALDDSNVGRYAQYLHKLTKHTQFIVITHRRGTMTAADILYGITMQEKGVSTLVSVDLTDKNLEKMN